MTTYICDLISEKLEHGAHIAHPGLRAVLGYLCNQRWDHTEGIYWLDLNGEDQIVIGRFFGQQDSLLSRAILVHDILQLCDYYGLTPAERGYLLDKLPNAKSPKRKSRKGEMTLLYDKLRVTNADGSHSYYPAEEHDQVAAFCRRSKLALHKAVKGEWVQILPKQ